MGTITVLPKPKTMGKLKRVSYTDRKWGNAKLIGPGVSVPMNMGRQGAGRGVGPRNTGQARRTRGKEGTQATIQGSVEPVGLA